MFIVVLICISLATTAKIDVWNYIKLKCFCRAKETINKMKRNLQDESICKLYICKELISKNLRNSYNSIANKQNAIFKWERKLNRHFCKEYI